MKSRPMVELVHEGRFAAEVDVTEIETGSEWSPYYDLASIQKLDQVRLALRQGNIQAAAKLARIYELRPVNAAE